MLNLANVTGDSNFILEKELNGADPSIITMTLDLNKSTANDDDDRYNCAVQDEIFRKTSDAEIELKTSEYCNEEDSQQSESSLIKIEKDVQNRIFNALSMQLYINIPTSKKGLKNLIYIKMVLIIKEGSILLRRNLATSFTHLTYRLKSS